MKILFVIGAGILPEQRIKRWQMVSQLYARLGKAFLQLGHQIYYYVHPEAYHEDVPPALCWLCEDQQHLPNILENFQPDFVFCWNGSSGGDVATATVAQAHGAKMVFSEQGWFPQATTIYFDLSGCNGKCGTKNRRYEDLSPDAYKRFMAQRKIYLQQIGEANHFPGDRFEILPPDMSKPVFVPLQDERDLNIVQDSPFKTMDEFVGLLAHKYPACRFVVRPHPKYPKPELGQYANVQLDNPKRPMFESLAICGMVVGINSTTLQESALLGYTVVSFGESLATGTGLFVDVRPGSEPADLQSVRVKSNKAAAVLYHLLCVKQMVREQLDNPAVIMKSGMFKELCQNLNWNSIYR
ncbi:MAG: hypothetical protein PHC51_09260 [bacterium]|nr:hypothetical protein [bacterium]